MAERSAYGTVQPRGENYLLGNIQESHLIELIASDQQKAFGQAKRDTLPRYCLGCEVCFACNGECPRNRFIPTPDGEPVPNYLCAGYKAFFNHIDHPMRLMADLLKQKRYADKVMGLLWQEEAQRSAGSARKRALPIRQRPHVQALPRQRTVDLWGAHSRLQTRVSAAFPIGSNGLRWAPATQDRS